MATSWKYFIALLALIAINVWLAVLTYPEPKLHLIACDVGQGDAILAVYGKNQVLVDGGPNDKVLECLDTNLPFWDRKIEVVILTHPQKDHFGGLVEVFKRYQVNKFIATPVNSGTSEYEVLKSTVGGSGTEVINPTIGMVVRLDLIQLDILHPSMDEYSAKEGLPYEALAKEGVLGAFDIKGDLNDYSVVTVLRLGEFEALLTGDIGPAVTSDIIATGLVQDVEYIKTPHHGSKNGLTEELLDASTPEIAVITVGKNPWGHPHEEVLEMLKERDIRILRTDESGDIEVVTDGKNWWIE